MLCYKGSWTKNTSVETMAGKVENHVNDLLSVYSAKGAVVRRTICGVPPIRAKTSPPNTWEYKTFSTAVDDKKNSQYIFLSDHKTNRGNIKISKYNTVELA